MPHGLPKGHKKSEETKRRMSDGALKRNSRIIGRYGYTAEIVNQAIADGKKFCSTCKKFLAPEAFGSQKVKTRCLECGQKLSKKYYSADINGQQARVANWRTNNPGYKPKKHPWRENLLRRYNVDESWYWAKLDEQKGHCALCPKKTASGGRHLHVDHDHATGRTRGILCETCNWHLHSIEKPGWGQAAMAYLQQYGGGLDAPDDGNHNTGPTALPASNGAVR